MTDGMDVLAAADTLDDVMACLSAMTPPTDAWERVQVRTAIIATLERIGYTGAKAGLVDGWLKQVKAARADGGSQGQAIDMADPEPWPTPVDGEQLLVDVARVYARYAIMPPGGYTTAAVWSLYTYVFDEFDISPILATTSPIEQCGKTRVMTITASVASRVLPFISTSTSFLFRSIDLWHPTIVIDELDAWEIDEERRGILNAGWTRKFANVGRVVGEDLEPRQFSVWAPKSVGLIGTLPRTLDDRSILIRMQRKTSLEKVDELGESDPAFEAEMLVLRRRMVRWANDNRGALRDVKVEPIPTLAARAMDNWRPLLVVAERASGMWPNATRKAATVLEAGRGNGSLEMMLLVDLRTVFEGHDRMATELELLPALMSMEHRPWAGGLGRNKDRPMTAQWLRTNMDKFNVHPDGLRPRGYTWAGPLEDAVKRYVPTDSYIEVPSGATVEV